MKKILVLASLIVTIFVGANFAQERPRIYQKQKPRIVVIPRNTPRMEIERTKFVLKGDGVTDDTEALNAWGRGQKVLYKGRILGDVLQRGRFLITWRVNFNRPNSIVRHNVFVWQYKGYDRTDWVNYSRRVRHMDNRIIDVGTGDSPFKRSRIIRLNPR